MPFDVRLRLRGFVTRAETDPPLALVVWRWLAGPGRSRADSRATDALLDALAACGPIPPAHELVEHARRAGRVGRRRASAELLAIAARAYPHATVVRRARRRLPGFVGTVEPEVVERAIAAFAAATGVDPPPVHRRATPLPPGKGGDVEALVRHRLSGGRSMVRKTMSGDAPREVLVYRSGLLGTGGPSWRPPACYHIEEEPPGRWHVFVEDLGALRRTESVTDVLGAARALGEMNGAHVGDPSLTTRFPWLADGTRRLTRLVSPQWADARLAGVVRDDLRGRVVGTLEALRGHGPRLRRVDPALPLTVCHGDAHAGNVVARDDRVVLIDWTMAFLGPLGTDLAFLLGVTNRAVRRDPAVVGAALGAYVDGVSAVHGERPDRPGVELAYRQRFVNHSFRTQLESLPPRAGDGAAARLRDAAARGWSGRRRVTIEANLVRLCDEAAALLATLDA